MKRNARVEHRQSRPHRPREAGSVLVLALLVTLLILGVGLTAMYLSSSGMKVSGNITRRQEAMSATETGLERALMVLNNATDWSVLLAGTACTSPDHQVPVSWPRLESEKGAILCDAAAATPAIKDVQVIELATAGYVTNLTNQEAKAMENLRYTVYIRNDDVEVNVNMGTLGIGPAWITDDDKRVILRIEGTARDSLSFFAVEVSIVVPPPMSQDPCPYGQSGGCDGTNKNSGEGNIS